MGTADMRSPDFWTGYDSVVDAMTVVAIADESVTCEVAADRFDRFLALLQSDPGMTDLHDDSAIAAGFTYAIESLRGLRYTPGGMPSLIAAAFILRQSGAVLRGVLAN